MSELTDKQRLDWLEANLTHPLVMCRYTESGGRTFVDIANNDDETLTCGATLRDAIDGAIDAFGQVLPEHP